MPLLTKKEFDKLFELNTSGNPQEILDYLNTRFFNNDKGYGRTEYDNKRIDFKFFYEKYKEYINWWDSTFGKKNQQYVAKKDAKVNIMDFGKYAMYEQRFELPKDARELYLFGNHSMDSIRQRIKVFKIKIGQIDGKEEETKD